MLQKKDAVLLILAGGRSSRMGMPKGLLPYKSTYWILDQIASFSTGGETVYIGLGYDYQLYFDAIPWFEEALESPQEFHGKKVRVVINHQPEFGLFSTLQSVLNVLNTAGNKQDIFVLPVDVPLLKISELEKIIVTKNTVVIPEFKGKNGHPVKLHADFWKSLPAIPITDTDARLDIQIKKLQESEITKVVVKDDAILKNLNTPEAWKVFMMSSE